MSYILKHKDTELLRFNLVRDIDGIHANILSINEKQKNLLPLDKRVAADILLELLARCTS